MPWKREFILMTLAATQGNKKDSARQLGISGRALYDKLLCGCQYSEAQTSSVFKFPDRRETGCHPWHGAQAVTLC